MKRLAVTMRQGTGAAPLGLSNRIASREPQAQREGRGEGERWGWADHGARPGARPRRCHRPPRTPRTPARGTATGRRPAPAAPDRLRLKPEAASVCIGTARARRRRS